MVVLKKNKKFKRPISGNFILTSPGDWPVPPNLALDAETLATHDNNNNKAFNPK
jgi:hypothetical protein